MIAAAKNKNTIVKRNGRTADITKVVIDTYNKDFNQVRDLAETFKAGTIAETCENIFNYIIENVHYKVDPPGVQWVKNPARLIADSSGDCKSMSIFTASCLRCLDIDHFFRFVSFTNKKEATHVYVVARDENNSEIIIDPVVRPVQFNKQEPYTFKSDMAGTDIYYMSGIRKQSGIGEIAPERFSVYLGENETSPETFELYSKLDLLWEMVNIATSEAEKNQLYAQIETLNNTINSINTPTISGIFDLASSRKMADKMKESGMFYIYLFIPDSEISKYSEFVKTKRATQQKTFRYAEQADIWHNTSACMDLARSGIIARTGMQPEKFIESCKKNDYKIEGVGSLMVILGVISSILSIIQLITSIFGKKRDEPTESEVNSALIKTSTDFPKSENKSNVVTAGLGSYFPYVLGGAALLTLIANKFSKK